MAVPTPPVHDKPIVVHVYMRRPLAYWVSPDLYTKPPVVHVYTRRAPVGSSPVRSFAPATSSSDLSIDGPAPSPVLHAPAGASCGSCELRALDHVAGPTAPPPDAVPVAPVSNSHAMATRGKLEFQQPRLGLHATTVSPVPSSHRAALTNLNWRKAME